MRIGRTILLSASVLALAAAAAPAAPDAAKPHALLQRIPAGTTWFAVVNDLQAATKHLERYAGEIGLGEPLQQAAPDGLLATMLGAARLGDGFDPTGGVAVAMLNPADVGVDLMGLLRPGAGGKPELPVAVFLPGKGVESVLAAWRPEKAGDNVRLVTPAGPMFARQLGGHVVLGSSAKVVGLVADARKTAASELTARQRDALGRGDLALYVNMEVVAPLAAQGLKLAKKDLHKFGPQVHASTGPVLDFYARLLGQCRSALLTVRLGASALVVEEVAEFQADSAIAKILAAARPAGGPLLDRLPSLPYVLALGATAGGAEAGALGRKLALPLLETMYKDHPALVKRTQDISRRMAEQIRSSQLVLGGAPRGRGLFGAAWVCRCKDAGKLQGLLVDYGRLLKDSMAASAPPDGRADIEAAKLVHTPKAETVAGVPVAAVDVTHPALAEMSEADRETMSKVLGESRVRIRMAAAGPRTAVIAFGGTNAFLAEALRAAQAGGGVHKDPHVRQALEALPRKPVMVMVFNAANLWELISRGAEAMGKKVPPFDLTARTPLAVGAAIEGTSVVGTLVVPNDLTSDLVSIVQALARPRAERVRRTPRPGGAEDF
jgi:hypothetical protein